MSGHDLKFFRRVSIEIIHIVEEKIERIIFVNNFVIQEEEYIRELAQRSIGKFDKTEKLVRFNNHIILTNDIDCLFKCFQFPSCDISFKKACNFTDERIK